MAEFTNQASLTYSGTTIHSNIVTGELLEVLTVTKTAVQEYYRADESVAYVITIVNSGGTDLTELTLTDSMGHYKFGTLDLYPMTYVPDSVRYYVNGVLQTAPMVTAGNVPVVFSRLRVPAEGNATLVYESKVNQFAPLGESDTITNEVTVDGGGLSTPMTAQEVIHTRNESKLTVSKSICPASVTEDDQVTYSFIIQNTGNLAVSEQTRAIIRDTFKPILKDISVEFNGTPWALGGEYRYNEATGEFSTEEGKISVGKATYTQDPTNGVWRTDPGYSLLTVTGTL